MRKSLRMLIALCTAAGTCLAAVMASPARADDGFTCGPPINGGTVNVYINLKKGTETKTIELKDMVFTSAMSDTDKAEFMVQLIKHVLDPNEDYVSVSRPVGSNKVLVNPKHNWVLDGFATGRDGTREIDILAYDGAASSQEALCSLSGTGTGQSPTGGPGFVGVQVFGHAAQVQTGPGMPAQVAEQLLMQQLSQQGLSCHVATPADFNGSFHDMPHDANVIYIHSPAAAPKPPVEAYAKPMGVATGGSSMGMIVRDGGMGLDLMALSAPPTPVSSAGDGAVAEGLRLEVAPSVFSTGGVRVRVWGATFRLAVLDVQGRVVRTLAPAGGEARWDGQDALGRAVPSGQYFIRLDAPGGRLARRVMRVR